MMPDLIDSFENGDIKLGIYLFPETQEKTYWLQVSVGALELKEHSFQNLLDLLYEFKKKSVRKDDPVFFYSVILSLVILVLLCMVVF